MKKIFIIAGMMVAGATYAQNSSNGYLGNVGINTTTPGATLDVNVSKSTSLDKTYGQGIAFPRVKRSTLNAMSKDIVLSSMVYVENVDTTSSIDRTVDVDAVGYYFFNGTKWTKLGGGASNSSSSVTELSMVKGTLDTVDGAVPSTAWDNGIFTVIGTGNADGVTLPNPGGNNKHRIISFRNQSTTQRNYAGSYQPKSNTTINSGRGHLLQSDGNAWYVIGGF